MTPWRKSHRYDERALPLADKHYNRQKPGTPQFVPPGRNLVLLTEHADALWVSVWQEYAFHAWKGAWVCSLFRNESPTLSSTLITEAVALTVGYWGDVPPQGFITFVDPSKIRAKRDPGRCFRRAGWRPVGETAKGLVVLRLDADEMPRPLPIPGTQMSLFGGQGNGG